MDGSTAPGRKERNELLAIYRRHPDPAVRLRAQIILLLADGQSWSMIVAVLYCSTRTIAGRQKRYDEGGIDALVDEQRGRRPFFAGWLMATVFGLVTSKTPRDFGYFRSRWCCGTKAHTLSQRIRKRAEESIGWCKTICGLARARFVGRW